MTTRCMTMKKSNEPIKTKKAMKTMKFFSMAALALVGAMMTGCSSEDNLAGNQQPAKQDNIVTVTTTVGLGSVTRALSSGGVKTFEVGDQIALFYEQDESFDPVKAVATAENISADGKSATFTFTLTNPESGSNIALCYPAAFMDNPSGELRPALTQDGTLNGSVKANDLGYATGNLVGTDLPASISLTNPFAVVAFTLKDGKGTDDKADDVDVTSNITEMTIELPDYSRTYTITREAVAGPIYVVLNQTDNTDAINITATGGGKTYTKSYTKGYTMDNFYQQGLLMTQAPVVTNLSTINSNYTASDGETLTGTLGKTVKISIADGATVTLSGVDINTNTTLSSGNYPGITCLGTATIILKDGTTNSVRALNNAYPGIYVPVGHTLTIQGETLGTGILNATGRGSTAGAGIGAASESTDIYRSCGNIVIAGGVINATAGSERAAGIGCGGSSNPGSSHPSTCGTITITGGTITATGGKWAPGIGGGYDGDCGDITIANTVTSVTATKGDKGYYSADLFDCIGRGRDGDCGTVKFGTQTMYNGSSWTTTPTSGNTYGGLRLIISQTTYAADTWTLTPVLP